MTRDDILTLARAGFTAAQITALAQIQTAPAPAPAPAPEAFDAILAKLGVISDSLQAGAIMTGQQPAQQTADDILANIIAPPRQSDNK